MTCRRAKIAARWKKYAGQWKDGMQNEVGAAMRRVVGFGSPKSPQVVAH